MKPRFLTGRQAETQLLRLVDRCVSFGCAVAWATDNNVSRAIEKHAVKAEHLVVGTHLYQTCPDLLTRFAELDMARVVLPVGDLFHPKVYVFRMEDGMAAIVGSHNMTTAAFGKNIEASVLLVGQPGDSVLRDLSRFVVDAWWGAEAITGDFLFAYRRQHAAKRDAREELKRFVKIKRPRRPAGETPVLDLSWPAFVRAIGTDKFHNLSGRLDLLDGARLLFGKHGSFAKMSVEDRRRIAGTEGDNARESGPFDWGWFGAMGGFGDFAHLVNEDPSGLSHALDAIPLNGPVAQRHYETYVRRFERAFVGLSRVGSISSGTRLLAMKRPDVFLGFNSANRKPLCERLGVAPTTTHLGNYWERVVEPIKASRWWTTREPTARHQNRIWNGRAALLDAIYYEPV